MKEGDVQQQIIEYLTRRGVRVTRYNTRAIRMGGRLMFTIRRGCDGKPDVGHPDLRARGRATTVWIETKAPDGVQSDAQKAWQRQAESEGDIYILARCVEDVMALFEPRPRPAA